MLDVRHVVNILDTAYDCVVAVNDSLINFGADLNVIASTLIHYKEVINLYFDHLVQYDYLVSF